MQLINAFCILNPFAVALLWNTGVKWVKNELHQEHFSRNIASLIYSDLFIHFYLLIYLFKFVANKTKGGISKRVFQENKARQIFRKTNISYPLCVSGGKKCSFFRKI